MIYKLTLVTASSYKEVVRSKFVSDVSVKKSSIELLSNVFNE